MKPSTDMQVMACTRGCNAHKRHVLLQTKFASPMVPDAGFRPSNAFGIDDTLIGTEVAVEFIHACGPEQETVTDDDGKPASGKWMVFCDTQYVDDVWMQVDDLVRKGLLYGGKVSTRKDGKSHVICVYTKDYRDEADVMHARDVLRSELGIDRVLYYKRDRDTMDGVRGSYLRE